MMRLHRTKDGATVTIPKDMLRQWEGLGAAYVRVEWHGGPVLLWPYTQVYEPCYKGTPPGGGDTSGDPDHRA